MFQQHQAPQPDTERSSYPIIVHSHLAWDWVWQRPQQFLSRLSKNHRIFYVEQPSFDTGDSAPSCVVHDAPDYPNIKIVQVKLPEARRQDEAWVEAQQRKLVQGALSSYLAVAPGKPVQWFYDPMAVGPFLDAWNEAAVVYDCMDELSQFRNAHPLLLQRERTLLNRADVVFTGGRKMWEKRKNFNPNCHFYGCGVDVEHFGQARQQATQVPADLDTSREATLGYFGVVDERMDYELVAALADINPHWTVAIVGPTTKVDESELPQRDNIQWLGGRSYDELPAYVKGFDLCLMPFARNEATEYINPTKALEYMAAGKAIISTAVPDVVTNFGSVVQIAQSPREFIEHCRIQLEKPNQKIVEQGLKMAWRNTWEVIVVTLEQHIDDAISTRLAYKTVGSAPAVEYSILRKPVAQPVA